jgi:hypothetical protein
LHYQIANSVHCESSTNHDVVENLLRIQVVSLRDLLDPLRPTNQHESFNITLTKYFLYQCREPCPRHLRLISGAAQ